MINDRHATAELALLKLKNKLGVTGQSDALDIVLAALEADLVDDVVRARVLHLHHHVRVQEVGLDHVWHKGRVLLLEHDGHNVVAYVPLPLQLEVTDKQSE